MPSFATYSDLTEFAGGSELSESAILSRAKSKTAKTVFLSHSSRDDRHLPGVILILENHGGRVYIDDGDARLPDRPSKETAAILRDTIRNLSRFVIFVTPNSKHSRWIPWELGLGDAYRTPRNIALFPAAESTYDQSWADQEYLGLYQRIVWGHIEGFDKPSWIVYDHIENVARTLRDWLKSH